MDKLQQKALFSVHKQPKRGKVKTKKVHASCHGEGLYMVFLPLSIFFYIYQNFYVEQFYWGVSHIYS